MKIIVLMGSPNRDGSTGILAENFKRGAEEAGHSVEIIDVCHADIHPCIGCVRCGFYRLSVGFITGKKYGKKCHNSIQDLLALSLDEC